jgi:hypothetical protein
MDLVTGLYDMPGEPPQPSASPAESEAAVQSPPTETSSVHGTPTIEAELDEMISVLSGMGRNLGSFWGSFRKQVRYLCPRLCPAGVLLTWTLLERDGAGEFATRAEQLHFCRPERSRSSCRQSPCRAQQVRRTRTGECYVRPRGCLRVSIADRFDRDWRRT